MNLSYICHNFFFFFVNDSKIVTRIQTYDILQSDDKAQITYAFVKEKNHKKV